MPRFGVEVAGFREFEPLRGGERIGARAGEQHVLARLHHAPRGEHRVAHAGRAADRTGAERRAVHDRRVEFVLAFGRIHGAAPGVEQRAVLEHPHRDGDGVERAAAIGQHALRGLQDCGEFGAVPTFGVGIHRFAQDRACAAVNRDDRG